MPDNQLPRALIFGKLMSGNRKTGAPKLRYKGGLKWHLKSAGIDVHTWEDEAKTDLADMASSLSPSQQLRGDVFADTTLPDKKHSQLVT